MSRRTFLTLPLGLAAALAGIRNPLHAQSGSWRAGVGKVDITPSGPVWMAGYASRSQEGEGALQPLWAKALAIEDPGGRRAVLITADNCGIPRHVGEAIASEIGHRHGIGREAVLINLSHTHCGPKIEGITLPFREFNEGQWDRILAYTERFKRDLCQAADAALRDLAPARLSWGSGEATFAVNRRNNREADVPSLRAEGRLAGPVDHDVPVLAIHGAGDRLKAVVFCYACHTTTLNIMQFNGDYAGFAQAELERRHPGATALFTAGCGGDINPLPRRTIERVEDYGRQLADAVDAALGSRMQPVSGTLRTGLEHVPLDYVRIPTREEVEAALTSQERWEPARARYLLAQIEERGAIERRYPFPVQSWRLGGLTWIALGGEPVVDYALRIKRELGPNTSILGYSNDIMAYIPSERVLSEGGYEGASAMVFFGRPSPWAPGLEDKIVGAAKRLARG